MIAAPSTTPSGSDDDVEHGWNASRRQATTIADEERDEHGDAAERRRRVVVHAPLVGRDDRAELDRERADDRREEEVVDRGDSTDVR